MPKVINKKYLPTEPPINFCWLLGLTLYTFDAGALLWGAYIAFTTFILAGSFIAIGNEQPVYPEDIA